MNHPLGPDFEKLTDKEILEKVSELTKRLNLAYRFGNDALIRQVSMLLEDFKQEQYNRDRIKNEKINENQKKKGTDWDKLIDI